MKPLDLPVHDIPALSGNNAPIQSEDVFTDMKVIGEVPKDLNGLYVRNGPNPYFQPEWRYHAFDGDGMLHAVKFENGKVTYRNKWVKTSALQEELAAEKSLWKGIKETWRADRPDEPLKNTANTDVKYHAGRLISMWYRAGMPYAVDPDTLETIGTSDFDGAVMRLSAHSRPDARTGELIFFDYSLKAPYMGPSLPHDMAITEHFTILHDFPLRPDPEALKAGRYKIKFNGSQPSRFGIVPRYGQAHEVRWFNAKPAYLLHVVNAWEEGDEIVMVGTPYKIHLDDNGQPDGRRLEKTIHNRQRDFMLYEWRFDLKTGQTHERILDDVLNTEFPVINSMYQGRKNQYSYNIMFAHGGKEEVRFPGLVKYDISAGSYVAYSAGPQFFYNEPGFAPRDHSESEDDGYLVVLVWNPKDEQSEIQIFDCKGAKMAEGPIARVILPRRIPHGFHATYVSQTTLNRWK